MTRRHGANVTLKDIAERIGVSAMTVSRALSGKDNLVNARTVRRIRDVADELGYTPNLLARSLRGERLPTIVVFAEFISAHHYLAELMDVVARSIEEHAHGVITCQSSNSLLAALKQFHLSGGVILAPPESLFYDDKGRPVNQIRVQEPIIVIHSAVEQQFLNEISPDLADAAFQAARHLLNLGHRRLGFLGGPAPDEEPHWFQKREEGIRKAMAARDLQDGTLRFQPCPNATAAPAALQHLMRNDPGITALICLNDEIAIAAIHGAQELGRRIPEDLSVVGSNDIRLARFFRPALTTVAIDVHALVENGLGILFEEIRQGGRPQPTGEPVKVLQKCELIIRESTAPAPSHP
ncbi:MAG: LacI family DNA-binding transcriptional regulator [Phycisphaerae bacterium]